MDSKIEEPKNESQDVNIAIMTTDIKYIKDSLRKIDSRLDVMDGHYIRREEVEKLQKDAKATHDDFEKRIRLMEMNLSIFTAQVKTWGTVAIIALSIIEFFLNFLSPIIKSIHIGS